MIEEGNLKRDSLLRVIEQSSQEKEVLLSIIDSLRFIDSIRSRETKNRERDIRLRDKFKLHKQKGKLSYRSDTMSKAGIEWVTYGKISDSDFIQGGVFSIDSLVILNGEWTTLVADWGTGGRITSDKNRPLFLPDLTHFIDLNEDKKLDVLIDNHEKSGVTGNIWKDAYIWTEGRYELNEKYMATNLRYIESIKRFYSSHNPGGGEYFEYLLKPTKDGLKAVHVFHSYSDGLKTEINLSTGDTIMKDSFMGDQLLRDRF